MPDLYASQLAQAFRSAAAGVAAVWEAIPGQTWIALYVAWVVGSVVFIVMQRRRPTATLAWIMGFISLPLLGAPIYYFFGPRKLLRRKVRRELAKRFASRLVPAHRDHLPSTLASRRWLSSLARVATAYGDAPPKPARAVRLFMEGDLAYDAIEAAMRNARAQIHLEYYIFEPDEVGTRWRDLLVKKAREGVAVRLLVDALGSKNCKPRFWRPLIDAGGEVRLFNPPKVLKLRASLLNFRTHRKIVVIDGAAAFTGGLNVSASSSGSSGNGDGWRDTHLSIEGPPALDLQMIFLEDWLYAGTGNSAHMSMDELLMNTPEDIGRWFPQPTPREANKPGPWVQIVASGPDESIPSIQRFFFTAISSARRRVWITTPYFVPDEPVLTALVTAKARGVDVRLILPRLGDSRFVAAAASTFAEEVMGEGVSVWEYTPRMIHAKTIVIDDELAIVGTANFDNRSFRLNFEVVAAVYDGSLNAELAAAFEQDLTAAVQLRPDNGRESFALRLVKSAARLAAPVL
jgi:cardiolipin synthase